MTLTYKVDRLDTALWDSWRNALDDFEATTDRVPAMNAVDLHLHVGAMDLDVAIGWAKVVASRITGLVPAQVTVCPERVWLAAAEDEAMSDADRRRALRSKWERD